LAAIAATLAGAASAQSAPPDRGDGWASAAPNAVGVDPEPLAGLPAAIARGDYPKTTSVLVVRDGKLVYEAYFGAGGPGLLNDTRSAMKSVTGLALGVAIGKGASHPRKRWPSPTSPTCGRSQTTRRRRKRLRFKTF
jgi:CubicO group peptidase (beta-lactamase class C family)